MKNIDIHEWLENHNIDSATTKIVDREGTEIFVSDLLTKHLEQQFSVFKKHFLEKEIEKMQQELTEIFYEKNYLKYTVKDKVLDAFKLVKEHLENQ
jgi:hypothetical protein